VRYAIERLKERAEADPSILTSDVLTAAAEDDMEGMLADGTEGLMEVLAVSHSGMSVEAFQAVNLLLLVAATSAIAADQHVLPLSTDQIAHYRDVGEWIVHENRTRGSCFISRTDAAGHLVQIGLTKDRDYGYIGIFQKGVELGEGTNDVAILINGNLYAGASKNVVQGASGDYRGGQVVASDANRKQLRRDLEQQKEMIVFPDKPFTVSVNLDHMRNAIFEARECTTKLHGS
tara:strand:- start:5221 stop:5919 length:699 start_codon:yes stop_codon:yes gene_type:complete